MHEIGVREVVTFAGMQFNIQTLEMTWLAMAIVILIAFLATRSLKLVPSGWQNVIEMVIVWLNEQIGVINRENPCCLRCVYHKHQSMCMRHLPYD